MANMPTASKAPGADSGPGRRASQDARPWRAPSPNCGNGENRRMRALRIYAGPKARQHIEQHGLRPEHVGVVPGAAGGPKGLILGLLDRFIFGEWLSDSTHPVDLVGASIGAWRMATACLDDPRAAFDRL